MNCLELNFPNGFWVLNREPGGVELGVARGVDIVLRGTYPIRGDLSLT